MRSALASAAMSYPNSSGRAHRPLPFVVKACLWGTAALVAEVTGLILIAHAAGLGPDPLDETTEHVVWGGLLVTAGLLTFAVITALSVQRYPAEP